MFLKSYTSLYLCWQWMNVPNESSASPFLFGSLVVFQGSQIQEVRVFPCGLDVHFSHCQWLWASFVYFFVVKCPFASLPTCTLDFKLICRIYLSPVLIFCHFMCCKHLRVFILFLTLYWIFCWTEFLISALLNLSIFSFMISTICILISPCLSWSHQNISSLLFLWIFIILSLSFYYDLSLCCDVSI